ncbi:MAG: antibiotic biosynthesis monooxygenase [Gammaproteobacteria bacterium]
MHVTIVDVHVKEEFIEDFIAATKKNHESSVLEQGNRRFDIMQHNHDTSHFVLYEAYMTEHDALDHKQTSHYLNWRKTVEHWMAKPRKGDVFTGLLPATN